MYGQLSPYLFVHTYILPDHMSSVSLNLCKCIKLFLDFVLHFIFKHVSFYGKIFNLSILLHVLTTFYILTINKILHDVFPSYCWNLLNTETPLSSLLYPFRKLIYKVKKRILLVDFTFIRFIPFYNYNQLRSTIHIKNYHLSDT